MDLLQLIGKLKGLSDFFSENGIKNIYVNSKIYKVFIADQFGHRIINGRPYSPDAKDGNGSLYEYKHYMQSSSNHTWTFIEHTIGTINRLYNIKSVYFVAIDDKNVIPEIEKVYIVPGGEAAEYLKVKELNIENHRKMINISSHQIIKQMPYELMDKHDIESFNSEYSFSGSKYHAALNEIFITAGKIGEIIHVDGILTDNKLWKLLVACEMGHKINSGQKKYDAYDIEGRTYEYKVSKMPFWIFRDISDNVLQSYLSDEKIILAVIDTRAFVVRRILACRPKAIVEILDRKLWNSLPGTIGREDIERMIGTGDAKWIL